MEDHHQNRCLNCHSPIPPTGVFCPQCGQKNATGKVSIKEMLIEFLDMLYSLDNRIFRTIRYIFVPGKLTKEYFDGKHKKYLHPLRLFLLMGLLHFAAINYKIAASLDDALGSLKDTLAAREYQFQTLNKIDSIGQTLKSELAEPQCAGVIDTLLNQKTRAFTDLGQDELKISTLLKDKNGDNIKLKESEIYHLPVDTLVKLYQVESFLGKIALKQIKQFYRDPSRFARYVLGNLIWMVLLMMPMVALILKGLYMRSGRYFVEHLIFSFHYHSFAFLIMTPAFLFFGESESALWAIVFLIVLFYQFIAMKNFYNQSVLKTMVKWGILNFSYLFLFLLFVFGTAAVSFLMF